MHAKKQTDSIDLLETPFEDIALAFSGGGFRAGTFALGVLSYLHETPLQENTSESLLSKVKYLSSASGGTIATAIYALYSSQGHPFYDYYKALFEQTEGTHLVSEALRILNNKKEWKERPEKQPNLINSFALAYDKHLFHSATAKDLQTNQDTGNSQLEEVCFNSTELYNGLLFRQTVQLKQGHWKSEVLYGNFNLSLNQEVAKHLLISDLLAASSCFPGGFEPIVFPQDFASSSVDSTRLRNGLEIALQELDWDELKLLYNENEVKALVDSLPKPLDLKQFKSALQQLKLNESLKISLMDGGITDNQGVESMMQANQRRIESIGKPFDLMMVCDVASHYMNPYQLPQQEKTAFESINRVRIGSLIACITAFASLLLIWRFAPSTFGWSITQCLMAIVIALSFALFFVSEKIKTVITGEVNGNAGMDLKKIFPTKILELLFNHFGNLRFNFLKNMLVIRLTTLITLSNDVFLKRIRYLLYNQFFELNNLKKTGRAKTNHIYDLSFSNDLNRLKSYSTNIHPSKELQKVAENAFGMGTTLWFSEENDRQFRKASIIACGQFNTCFNLLDYVLKLKTSFDGRKPVFDQLSEANQTLVNKLQNRLEKDFEHFNQDPFWMYNRLGKASAISEFKEVSSDQLADPKGFEGLR